LGAVREHLGRKKWKCTYYDVRTCDDGGTRVGKFRTILGNGDVYTAIETPIDALKAISDLWHERNQGNLDRWHGFRISISSDGSVEVKFNYDDRCFEAPDFCNP
jgi:hypothetical protein